MARSLGEMLSIFMFLGAMVRVNIVLQNKIANFSKYVPFSRWVSGVSR